MSGKIPQSFIDQLLARVDIVDVIESRVALKKAGREYQACCPFHNEKTPSFTVSPTKQFYYCFGCGAHGSAIRFLMEFDRLSFVEAVSELANSVGVEVPREAQANSGQDHSDLYPLMDEVARYFSWQLRQHPEAANAIEYLKKRGLSGEIAAKYRLGYAPPGWRNLLDTLGGDSNKKHALNTLGLLSQNDQGKQYDKFRNRIIFPIRDKRGRVIAFGGRVLGEDKPKYLNSPETPLFHKSRELYGLYEARLENKNPSFLMVVEGYMDTVALAQFGLSQVVATLGTATTPQHLDQLYRATPEVVFCFDGDRAGRSAAWKALEITLTKLEDGRQAKFLFLPENEDPDSMIRTEGARAFRERIAKQSQPASEFLFGQLQQEIGSQTAEQRARFTQKATPLIESVPPGTLRNLLQDRLSMVSGSQQIAISSPRRRPYQAQPNPLATLSPLRRALALLVQNPELANTPNLPLDWQNLAEPGIDLLKRTLEICQDNPEVTTGQLTECFADEQARGHLSKLATLAVETREDNKSQFHGALENLARKARAAEIAHLQAKMQLSSEDKARLRQLLARNR